MHGNVFLFNLHQYQVGSPDASPKQRGMDLVKENTAVLEHFAGNPCLEDPVVGQGRVGPSNETIVTIPGALAVAQKAEVVRSPIIDASELAMLLLPTSYLIVILLQRNPATLLSVSR